MAEKLQEKYVSTLEGFKMGFGTRKSVHIRGCVHNRGVSIIEGLHYMINKRGTIWDRKKCPQ